MIKIYFDNILLDNSNYIEYSDNYKQFEDEFYLGSVASVKASLTIPYDALPSTLNEVKITIDDVDYLHLVVDSIEETDNDEVKLNLTDKLINTDVEYDFSSLIPITSKNLLNAICTQFGIPHDTFNYTNDNLEINSYDNTITAREYISMIAESAGSYVYINNLGKLVIEKYKHNSIPVTSSNNTYTINNAVYGLNTLNIDGKSTQETTTGRNLTDSSLYATATGFNGGSASGNYTNYRTTYTTAPAGGYGPYFRKFNFIPGTTYTLSVDIISNANHEIRWGYERSTNTTQIGTTKTRISYSFTAVEATNQTIIFYSSSLANWHANDWFEISNIQIELGTEAHPYEPYTGGIPAPNSDYPQEIESVGYENLFDETNRLSGYIPRESISENLTQESNTYTTNWIKVHPNSIYTLSGGNKRRIQFKNSNGEITYIYGTSTTDTNTNPLTFTTNDDTEYVRIYYTNQGDINIQLEESNTAHSYIPYGKYGIEYKTVGKNRFSGFIRGIKINSTTGVETIDTTGGTTDYIPIKFVSNNSYTLSGIYNGLRSFVCAYNEEKQFLGRTGANRISSITLKQNSFTNGTPQGTGDIKYIRITTYTSNGDTGTLDDALLANIQLEEGQATEYEPYQEQTQLIQLDEPLRSIGNVKDKLRIENNTLYVDRYIGKYIYDGSESGWQLRNTTTNNISTYSLSNIPSNYNLKTNTPVMCNNFTYLGTVDSVNKMYRGTNLDKIGLSLYYLSNSTSRITYINTNITTLANFKAWLSTHPTEVIYELATPTTEKIGTIDIALLDGTNNINIYSNINTDSNLSYYDNNYSFEIDSADVDTYKITNDVTIRRIVYEFTGRKFETSSDTSLYTVYLNPNNIFLQVCNDNDLMALSNNILGFTFSNIKIDTCNKFTKDKILSFIDVDNKKHIIINQDNKSYAGGFVGGYELKVNNTKEEFTTKDEQKTQIKRLQQKISGDELLLQSIDSDVGEAQLKLKANGLLLDVLANDSNIDISYDENGNPVSGELTAVRTGKGFKLDNDGLEISSTDTTFKSTIDETGAYFKDGNTVLAQYTQNGSVQKDLALYGMYSYGQATFESAPMFVAELYTDNNQNEGFGHFYNGGNL